MRLHRLDVSAFGPFPDEVHVDFDALSEAGLFLLTGPTGAGKTSVLDAVCFALYGDVPGDRATARRLRSDQAEPGATPRVSLECTLSGRRFRIIRSPAWQRPKKRGEGTTAQQASVTIAERIDDRWQPLTSRLDEAGHLVTGLVGMTLTQFTQVALLPQGRFQGFLRARSEERHRLLQQLFRTGRFEQVERWLRDHRLELASASRESHQAVDDLVSRLGEVAPASVPPRPDPLDPVDALATWARDLRAKAVTAADAARHEVAPAEAASAVAAEALERGHELAKRQQARAGALRELAELEAVADQIAALDAELATARRAAAVRPVLELVDDAERALAEAESEAEALRARVSDWAGPEPDLSRLLTEWTERGVLAEGWLPRAERLAELHRAALTDLEEAAAAAAETERVATEVARVPARLDAARTLVELEAQGHRIELMLGSARTLAELRSELARAEADRLEAHRSVLTHTERWLAIREERITGMAAELAGELAVGACCPVCGSAEHPQPAAARPGAPDASAERAARRLVDDAQARLLGHDEALRDLRTRAAVAEAACEGRSLAELEEARSGLHTQQRALRDTAGVEGDPSAGLRELDAMAKRLSERAARLAAERAARDARDLARADEVAALDAELTDLLADSGFSGVSELRAGAAERCHQLRRAIDADAAREAAVTQLRRARRRAQRAAAQAGFETRSAAVAALRDDAALARAEHRVRDHAARRLSVGARLDDAELQAAAECAVPDLPALAAAAEAAHDHHAAALANAELARTRADRAAVLVDRLLDRLAAWAPVRADLELATSLSAFVDGKSADNALRMRLSAYVLAHRLGQVVAAANQRLSAMSDQRYTLERTGQRGAGETRGGLSLLVRDDWSGQARDPATLSGGETFVVSLALALGLADVVIDEVGGATLDTLFVDEGFGTLDAETLDDVMDTLDSLRDGGRVVGVVSHVAELRDRIPTQLRVIKDRRGSSLALSRSSS